MKIAIHDRANSFSGEWINYCIEKEIEYKIVNCYDNDIIEQTRDCDIVMWHFHHGNPKDSLIAKEILFSLQQAGKKVFPDFNTFWHFDDKVGQKYLFEALGLPLVSSYVFVDKKAALDWATTAKYPTVFKLRGGAGSSNVKLVKTYSEARRIIKKAFSSGFRNPDYLGLIKDNAKKYFKGRTSFRNVAKYMALLFFPFIYKGHKLPREKNYVYFQDFITGNDCDIRVIVIDEKAFAIKRMVRENDFRASGSGNILYDKDIFDPDTIQCAFMVAESIGSNCIALDFVYDNGKPLLIEASYGFTIDVYRDCPGYWTRDMEWHEGSFNRYGWMVNSVLKND